MRYAMEELMDGKEINHHILQSLHSTLLSGVRSKGPLGQYRQDLVYIGKLNDPAEKATYIPPEFYLVREYMDDIIKFIKEGKKEPLIKAGLIHYQFEAVHPFNDGNGRLGRLLVPLILYNERTLSSPILYLSGFFDENKDAYIDSLHEVDETGNYENWLSFFLRAVTAQAKETQDLIDQIYQLFEDTRDKYKNTKSLYFVPFIEFIFDCPVFTVQHEMKRLGISYVTAGRLIKMFRENGDIQELPVRLGHSKLYEFRPLIDLLS
ncbi:hypothetical protein UZ36_08085 [Candidatus Nitromaritima sp. SCGC AAA799-C22]|nr:hypothetical protein UZ36_08085 [Candidatus Nitromaritima sp. SCGC AAA799-C22]